MKQQKTKEASGAGQKREAEEPLPLPTLGIVAEEEDFAPLRELLQPVARRPVNELGEALRAELLDGQDKPTRLCLQAFFAACDARAGEIERKRAHVATADEPQGERRHARLFLFLCLGAFQAA